MGIKKTFLFLGLFHLSALAQAPFPQGPNPNLTPGTLCEQRHTFRYPEHIPYCERDVSGAQKDDVIHYYDSQLGYQVGRMKRQLFKIDHYIPLCMGGSNHSKNLWPQHESVYKITDPLEQLACQKMAEGKLKQDQAVQIIKRAKNNLPEAQNLFNSLRRL